MDSAEARVTYPIEPANPPFPVPSYFPFQADAGSQTFDAIPSESLYAFPFGGEVEPQEPIPAPDSTPQQGPIEGSLVLFELPSSASENRPLTLSIDGPEGPAEVKLDL